MKNNNKVNETFAVNHAHYISQSNLDFTGERNLVLEAMMEDIRKDRKEIEKEFYKNKFCYKDKNQIIVNLDKTWKSDLTNVILLTSTHIILGEAVIKKVDNNKLYLLCETYINLKHIWFICPFKEKQDELQVVS